MAHDVYLLFVCPHCGRNLSRPINAEVMRAHLHWQCDAEQGGCSKHFELLYRHGEGVITKPSQPTHIKAKIAE